MRFDVAGMFPEWMNSDIRQSHSPASEDMSVGMPTDDVYKYLEDLDIEDGSYFYYLTGYGRGWYNYQADELNVTGSYELTFRMPPVPIKGTYEIRYAIQTNSNLRGMCQVYFGTDKRNLSPQGIPLDLRMGGQYRRLSSENQPSIVGWEEDRDDDDYNAEVDKKMRNNDFMKGPEYYTLGTTANTARSNPDKIRRIIVRADMDPEKTYYLKFKNVLDSERLEFYMDYLELCAKEVYDNPSAPEDIW